MSDLADQVESGPPLRLCLVLATSAGGVGRHVGALAAGLAAAGQRVVVAGPASTEQRFHFANPGSRVNGVDFRPVEIAAGLRPVADLRAVVRLSRLLPPCDVVHAHGLRAGVVAALAVRRGAVPRRLRHLLPGRRFARRSRPVLVVTLHNAVSGSGVRRRVLEFVEAGLGRRAGVVLAVSHDLVDSLSRSGAVVERAVIASTMPTPNHDRAFVRQSLGVDDTSALVLAVGRLHPQKGFDVLVAAVALLADVHPRPAIIIAGEGPQRDRLESLIAAAHVDVRLLGDRSDVPDLLLAADLVVMPSRWEGWPLAATEVLAAGRPLVASSAGGLPEVVADAAVLVPPGDPLALAAAIRRVLTDASLAETLSRAALIRARQLPTIDDVTASVLAIYRRAVGGT